jgi:hypothetical protein
MCPILTTFTKDFDCRKEGSDKKIPCTDFQDDHPAYSIYAETVMTLEHENDFNKALFDAGIAPDWIKLGKDTITSTVSRSLIDRPPHTPEKFNYVFSGYPIMKPDISVSNPKDIVTKGLGSIPELRLSMQATYMEIAVGSYIGGSPLDAAEAFSMPVFMLMQAVENMAQAKALGAQEEEIEEKDREERRKNLILLIVSVVLMVYDALSIDYP